MSPRPTLGEIKMYVAWDEARVAPFVGWSRQEADVDDRRVGGPPTSRGRCNGSETICVCRRRRRQCRRSLAKLQGGRVTRRAENNAQWRIQAVPAIPTTNPARGVNSKLFGHLLTAYL